ncbi:hypothetical protein ABPG74_021404 [Tetrahymena malaccensis]
MKKQSQLLILLILASASCIVFAQNTFTDQKTQTIKSCHFTCSKCTDSTELCSECQSSMTFYVKENSKFRCFQSCPRGYIPSSNDYSSLQQIECILDNSSITKDQDALIKKYSDTCGLSQFWDGNSCQNCSSNCMSCSSQSMCDECLSGYFWNQNSMKCSQCHSSCMTCKGPNFNDCVTCTSLQSFYPDANGVCDQSAQKIDYNFQISQKQDSIQNTKICSQSLKLNPTRYFTINFCFQYSQKFICFYKKSYSVQYKNLYLQNDPKWSGAELVDQAQCQIQSFAQKYSSLKDQISKCQFNQITKSTMGIKGQLITHYATILSQHLAQLNGTLINPQSLNDYINKQQLQNVLYIKKAKSDFTCDQLSCETQLNSYLPFIATSSNTKVSLRVSKEISMTQNGKLVDCFDQQSQSNSIDDQKLQETEMAFIQAAASQKSSRVKIYAIVDVCGRSTNKPNRVQYSSLLVSNYYGNGFFSATRSDVSGSEQIQQLYLQGADKVQNSNLKKCNQMFTNQYDSFSVVKVKFLEVQEVDSAFEKENNRYTQYSAMASKKLQQQSNNTLCSGLELGSFIISNDNQYNQLQLTVSPLNKILTSQIDFNEIKQYLKNLQIDENALKSNKIILSDNQAQLIFNLYLQDLQTQAQACYQNIQKAPQNIQITIFDFFKSNGKKCELKNEISSVIDQNNLSQLIPLLQASSWCSSNQSRCREQEDFYERDLANLLATIIRKEFEIEKLRSLLCENDKFEVTEAFKSLDIHGHGYLSSNDIKLFLSKNHVMTREKECDFLVYVFAKNHLSISFQEFLKIILPKQDDNLKEQCLERRKFRPSNQKPSLPFYIEEQLSKIFELEIQFIRETEAQKMDIMNNYGWNYRESFKRIARPGQYHIDKQAFYAFMIQNQFTEFSENSFKYILIRFNKDNNDIITMDEFCQAIFPSDYLADNPMVSERKKNPYLRYVKGDEQEFHEYVTGTQRQFDDQDNFDQEEFVYRNDVDNYNAQVKRQGVEQPRKFLKTSVQYENTQNVRPMIGIQYVEQKDDYPTLNQYLMKVGNGQNYQNLKQKLNGSIVQQRYVSPHSQSTQPNQNIPTARDDKFLSQRDFMYSNRSPINYLSSQKNLYLDYENFSKQKDQFSSPDDYFQAQPRYAANPKNYPIRYDKQPTFQQNLNENYSQLANSYLLKSQLHADHPIRNSMPIKPVGHNASTAKFDLQPNFRSQISGEKIQPFKGEDFTKSRFEQ